MKIRLVSVSTTRGITRVQAIINDSTPAYIDFKNGKVLACTFRIGSPNCDKLEQQARKII